MSPKLVTTQKYESLACDTVMAPAPIAITQSTVLTGEASPSAPSNGAIIPAVVVIATVEEPCAVFNIAARRNGKNIPTAESTSACCVINATIELDEITFPNTPPAAVTKSIGPTVFNVSFVIL